VTGATNLTSTLTVGGKVTANGALDVKGATTCVALTASGKITGDGGIGCTTLSASSTITANSGISLTGTLSGGNITSALVPTGKVDFSNAASQTGIHAVFA
jgi:hypothetical protein